jgi:putative transposase
MMDQLRPKYPIPTLCRLFQVSAGGYFDWQIKPDSLRVKEEGRLEAEIKAAHQRTRGLSGPERLQVDLAKHGVRVGVHRIKRIRKKLGIRCKQARKFKVTTDSRHNLPVAENLLAQEFEVEKPNQTWVSDITYVHTDEGWLYLAGIKDLFDGNMVGYSMSSRMTQDLVNVSLFRAVAARRPPKGLILHSDRGSQYCARSYANLLKQFKITPSMSRKGNCYDNAPMESFWGILKNELIHHRRYATREEAIREITEYIEVFYNRQRIQKRLGYLSPVAFERQYYEKQLAA